jgi:transcriptional regulator PpsR
MQGYKRFVESAEAILQRASGSGDARLSGAIASGFDLLIALDRLGVVIDTGVLHDDFANRAALERFQSWHGKPIVDIVTSDSRPKVLELLRAVALEGQSKPRQINIPIGVDVQLALSASALRLEQEGRVLLLCRDLSSVSRLQQQLVESQQRVEREYSRQRAFETRHQALFQLAREGMLVIEESSLRIIDANAAAYAMLGESSKAKGGAARERSVRYFPDYLESSSRTALVAWLARLSREPNFASFEGSLKNGADGESNRAISIRATLVRQLDGPAYMVGMNYAQPDAVTQSSEGAHDIFASVFEGMPDALVIADIEGRIMFANQSFLEMVQMANPDQIRNESLSRWFSRAEVDVSLLVGTLKQHGVVRQYTTDIRGEYGASTSVEIAGVMRTVNGQSCYGFAIRDAARKPVGEAQNDRFVPRSSDELRELVGRVPLKDIVAETADLIERLCIESALELTGDNRAAAAEMLGLSRQSLYVKLRRYGVGYDEAGEIVSGKNV